MFLHIFQTISNKSWHDSSPGSSLDEYREDSHHSSPNSSISKYRADSNPKDSSPDSSIGQYKEDSLHKNDSPTSNKSDFSDSYFWRMDGNPKVLELVCRAHGKKS